jgi:methionyl aminopeptidase
MAVIIKTPEEIEILREGGRRLATILQEVGKKVAPGVTTAELDAYAEELIRRGGDEPAFLGYTPEGVSYPFPASLCVSVNNEIVHGIPGDRVLKNGDIVTIDLGLKHRGLFTDHAISLPVGQISKNSKKLLDATREALYVGIEAARGGNTTGDIGHAIQEYIRPFKYGIIRGLSGHGVGRAIHEDPFIPNYGKRGAGELLRPGMVVALEPMIAEGDWQAIPQSDEYLYTTADGSRAAHFEHTILITEGEPEILTQI